MSKLEDWAREEAIKQEGDYKDGTPRAREFHYGLYEGALHLLKIAENWCAINAYDPDKGVCDEHTCDDTRGRNCSADELLNYLTDYCKGDK